MAYLLVDLIKVENVQEYKCPLSILRQPCMGPECPVWQKYNDDDGYCGLIGDVRR